MKKVYTLENLGCANCAAKIEHKVSMLPDVTDASVVFATKQLRLTARDPKSLLPEITRLATSIEPDIVVTENGSDSPSGTQSSRDLAALLSGAGLFAISLAFEHLIPSPPVVMVILYIVSYLILGGGVLLTALKNISKGQVFDENFLMAVATIGAFAIKSYPEAVGVMLFFRVGEMFEHRAVEKSRSAIIDAIDLRPETVTLVTPSGSRVIPAEQAKAGDILSIRPGDRIPLDCTVVEGESQIDTAPVTGEPVPVFARQGDSLISGCVNRDGVLRVRVDKPLSESMVTKILDAVENAAASKPKIDRFITRFARIYTPIVVAAAVLTAVLPPLVTGDWAKWIYTAITFLVISCPCALVLSVPLAFFAGIGAGSKKGILFKGGSSLEALSEIKAIVMDKTGTVTKGNFRVQDIIPFDESVTGDSLLALAAACEGNSTHPIALSIIAAKKEKDLPDFPLNISSVREIAGEGVVISLEDNEILCGNRKLMKRYGISVDKTIRPEATEVLVAKGNTLLGSIVISDTVKPDAKRAIAALKARGLKTAMLTGDEKEAAEAVASEVGIDEVHARLLPQEKLEKLKEIRRQSGSVMFVGDGINDAPVLAGADVSAAMGSGADAAIEAADVVFMRTNMEAVPLSITIAKSAMRIARQNITFSLVIKAAVLILGLLGLSNMWFAVFADTGVAIICILNSIRIILRK